MTLTVSAPCRHCSANSAAVCEAQNSAEITRNGAIADVSKSAICEAVGANFDFSVYFIVTIEKVSNSAWKVANREAYSAYEAVMRNVSANDDGAHSESALSTELNAE